MRLHRSCRALLIAPLLVMSPFIDAVAAEADVASLAWLAGCWQTDGGDAGSGEHWMPPAGGTMFGVSRTVKNGKTVAHEFMQVRLNTEGKLVFIALPSGQKEATFVASAVGPDSVIFENPEHDFPQKVTYAMQADGLLQARIEGMRGTLLRAFDFMLKRVACDAKAGSDTAAD